MTEHLKQALVKETERHIAHDILYDDVYVGPFTEKDGVDCAIHAVDWYRNNVWHPASQKPAGVDDAGRDILIVTMGPEYYGNKLQTWHIFSYMTWEWVKAHAGEFEKWAYLEDLLPDMKGGES